MWNLGVCRDRAEGAGGHMRDEVSKGLGLQGPCWSLPLPMPSEPKRQRGRQMSWFLGSWVGLRLL